MFLWIFWLTVAYCIVKQTENNSQQLNLLTQKLSDKKPAKQSLSVPVQSPAVTKTALRQQKSLAETNTPASARKSRSGTKLLGGSPGSTLNVTLRSKPVFTIGSKDVTADKEG